ncbi:S-adenosyl-L-methionine-dependent methyltransferase [Patellaria atrata CBS 101060]|uniref:S-adenosyl-L-methionine-dependent methyltransferase n=1 Tax=Patellaria atrata CBS 101060 TaxID=1346257 RepID=A0A9P4S7X3_9PEZI|nr:S-adenosyl-L-methionine-dependent methyltransferase [Patellaria atrata CBS 101060]
MSLTSSTIKSRVAESYTRFANEYLKWTTDASKRLRLRYMFDLLERLDVECSEGNKKINGRGKFQVLELGAGAGVPATQYLASYGCLGVTANDISTAQLELLAMNLPNDAVDRVNVVEGDMFSLNFPPESFNAVVCLYSLNHLPSNEQREMISRISSWLRPGGWLLVNVANMPVEIAVDEQWMKEANNEGGWMYWSSLGGDATATAVEKAGLTIRDREVIAEPEGGQQGMKEVPFTWIIAEKGDQSLSMEHPTANEKQPGKDFCGFLGEF